MASWLVLHLALVLGCLGECALVPRAAQAVLDENALPLGLFLLSTFFGLFLAPLFVVPRLTGKERAGVASQSLIQAVVQVSLLLPFAGVATLFLPAGAEQVAQALLAVFLLCAAGIVFAARLGRWYISAAALLSAGPPLFYFLVVQAGKSLAVTSADAAVRAGHLLAYSPFGMVLQALLGRGLLDSPPPWWHGMLLVLTATLIVVFLLPGGEPRQKAAETPSAG